MGRVDGYNPHIIRKDLPFSWTNVYEEVTGSSSQSALGKRKWYFLHITEHFYAFFSSICGIEYVYVN